MPVEIRELVIRAITSMPASDEEEKPGNNQSATDREVIVQECVRQVMSILKKKEER